MPPLTPINIELDFANKVEDFELVEFEFPEPTDPNELKIKPIDITNLDEFSSFV